MVSYQFLPISNFILFYGRYTKFYHVSIKMFHSLFSLQLENVKQTKIVKQKECTGIYISVLVAIV